MIRPLLFLGGSICLLPVTHSLTVVTTAIVLELLGLNVINAHDWLGHTVGVFVDILTVTHSVEWAKRPQNALRSLKRISHGVTAFALCLVATTLLINQVHYLVLLALSTLIGIIAYINNASAGSSSSWAGHLLRGFRLQSRKPLEEARRPLEFPWGSSKVPFEDQPRHFGVIGNTETGKSTWLEVMMSAVFPAVGVRPDYGAIVLDAKRNMVSFLAALGVPLLIFNPLDKRAVGWAIARNVDSEAMAGEFATAVIDAQKSGTENAYFYDSARLLIIALILSLQRAKPGTWTLGDLIRAAANKETMEAVIRKYHPRPDELSEFFKNSKKGDRNDVITTVKSILNQYSIVAARWESCDRLITVDEAVDQNVLVLGSDHTYSDLISKTNALFLHFLNAVLASLPDSIRRRIWIFSDEHQVNGRALGLEKVTTLGRSAGVCVVIAFQSIAGMIDQYEGNEHAVKSLLGLLRHKVIFGLDPDSAQWMSDYINSYEWVKPSYSVNSKDRSISYDIHTRATVTPQQLMDMHPRFDHRYGLTGLFLSPRSAPHFHTYSWAQIEQMTIKPSKFVADYERLPSTDPRLQLRPWTDEERKELGLPLLEEEKPESNSGSNRPIRKPRKIPPTS